MDNNFNAWIATLIGMISIGASEVSKYREVLFLAGIVIVVCALGRILFAPTPRPLPNEAPKDRTSSHTTPGTRDQLTLLSDLLKNEQRLSALYKADYYAMREQVRISNRVVQRLSRKCEHLKIARLGKVDKEIVEGVFVDRSRR